jgi:hypothetical protein
MRSLIGGDEVAHQMSFVICFGRKTWWASKQSQPLRSASRSGSNGCLEGRMYPSEALQASGAWWLSPAAVL